MSNFYDIRVGANIPYPWFRDYRIEAGSFPVAFSRAAKMFRADLRAARTTKKKIIEMTLEGRLVHNMRISKGGEKEDDTNKRTTNYQEAQEQQALSKGNV